MQRAVAAGAGAGLRSADPEQVAAALHATMLKQSCGARAALWQRAISPGALQRANRNLVQTLL